MILNTCRAEQGMIAPFSGGKRRTLGMVGQLQPLIKLAVELTRLVQDMPSALTNSCSR